MLMLSKFLLFNYYNYALMALCKCSKGLCLNHTVQKDSREVLGTSFRFGPTSEILENIQYGGSSVVKTDS